MSVSVKLRTEEFEKRNLVVGPIWLEMNGQEFPIDVWYDFPVVILGWWLNSLKPLIAHRAVRCECLFMDGPYLFEVTAQERAAWTIVFIRDELDGKKYLLEGEVAPRVLISEVLSAANVVADLCSQKGWASDDLVTLESEIRGIKSLMQSFQ